jgi:hypothetical protein
LQLGKRLGPAARLTELQRQPPRVVAGGEIGVPGAGFDRLGARGPRARQRRRDS